MANFLFALSTRLEDTLRRMDILGEAQKNDNAKWNLIISSFNSGDPLNIEMDSTEIKVIYSALEHYYKDLVLAIKRHLEYYDTRRTERKGSLHRG